jgi:hypothetical protein
VSLSTENFRDDVCCVTSVCRGDSVDGTGRQPDNSLPTAEKIVVLRIGLHVNIVSRLDLLADELVTEIKAAVRDGWPVMAQVRRILGHVTIEVAGAKRKCHRKPKDHVISKGIPCLVVKDPSTKAKKNYCLVCALEILTVAADDLHALRGALE